MARQHYILWNYLGTCHYEKQLIEINLRVLRKYRRSVLKTCIHEDLHRVFPENAEREIEELTEQAFDVLTPQDRRLLTVRYRRKLGI